MSNIGAKTLFSDEIDEQFNCDDNTQAAHKVTTNIYMKYAVAAINRAIADVRDGLKPVGRRLVYSMHTNNVYGSNNSKSASVIGDTIGKYHPHGNEAAYGALVRMAQPWNMKCPIATGQGNFGCPGENSAAAMRYTEVVLSDYGRSFFQDFHEETNIMISTYDQKRKEPVVLPARMPNLLINGTLGIGIGLSASIAPHNPREVLAGLIAIIEGKKNNHKLTLEDIMKYIPGPDFPNKVSISDYNAIKKLYTNGQGSLKIYSDYTIVKQSIIFNSIPYGTSREEIIMQLIDCKECGVLPISSVVDESTDNIRIVVQINSNYDVNIVKNLIYKHTKLSYSFSNKWFALDSQQVPRQYNLMSYLYTFLSNREQIILTKYRHRLYDYKKDLAKALSFLIACINMPIIIKLIRQAPSKTVAKQQLMDLKCSIPSDFDKGLLDIAYNINYYYLSSEQADYILSLRLIQISQFEQDKLIKQITKIKQEISTCLSILNDKNVLLDYMINECKELALKHKQPRTTTIHNQKLNDNPLSFIEKEDVMIILDHKNYIKKIPLSYYKVQKAGGKGSANTVNASRIQLKSNTHGKLLFCFKDAIKQLPVYMLPTTDRHRQGRSLVNVIDNLAATDQVIQIINIDLSKKYIIFIYTNGVIRKNLTKSFESINRNGKKYSNRSSARLLNVVQANGNDDIVLATKLGYHLITSVNNFNTIKSRTAMGVTGIKLKKDDVLVSGCIIEAKNSKQSPGYLCTLSNRGKGKLSPIESLGRRNRGTQGCKVMKFSKQDKLFGVFYINSLEDSHIIITTKQNRTIRVCTKDIPIYSTLTTVGNNLVQFDNNNPIVSAQVVQV